MRVDEAVLMIEKEWVVKETEKALGIVIDEKAFDQFQKRGRTFYLYWIPKGVVRGWNDLGMIFERRFAQKMEPEVEELVQYKF
jgi:hypothetical protein